MRENFHTDPLDLIGKTVVFEEDLIETDGENYGYDFPKNFQTEIKKYVLQDRISDIWIFTFNFSDYIESNKKLWKPIWSDTVDGRIVTELTWEKTKFYSDIINVAICHPLQHLPFTPRE